jgi:hypothetical protein
MESKCPECGADWSEAITCEDDFHQFLYWEMGDMENLGVVHHLMVLSYHLQHPSLYSPDGLKFSMGLLVDFVARGVTPQDVRQRDRDKLDSGNRQFKIKATAEAHGSYAHPIEWTMRAQDVVAGGSEHYVENVRAWAQSIHDALKVSGNLPVG